MRHHGQTSTSACFEMSCGSLCYLGLVDQGCSQQAALVGTLVVSLRPGQSLGEALFSLLLVCTLT